MENPELFIRVQQEQGLLNKLRAMLDDAQSALKCEPIYPLVARDRVERALNLINQRIGENAK